MNKLPKSTLLCRFIRLERTYSVFYFKTRDLSFTFLSKEKLRANKYFQCLVKISKSLSELVYGETWKKKHFLIF